MENIFKGVPVLFFVYILLRRSIHEVHYIDNSLMKSSTQFVSKSLVQQGWLEVLVFIFELIPHIAQFFSISLISSLCFYCLFERIIFSEAHATELRRHSTRLYGIPAVCVVFQVEKQMDRFPSTVVGLFSCGTIENSVLCIPYSSRVQQTRPASSLGPCHFTSSAPHILALFLTG